MNRTFLNLLIIATVLIITVVGQKSPKIQRDYAPWDVITTQNGSFYVFGITLGKTTIEEANQILSSFAASELIVDPAANTDEEPKLHLVAVHKDLVISGVMTELHLTYLLDKKTLHGIYSKLVTQPEMKLSDLRYKLPADLEMHYLSTPIASISYQPSVDFGEDTILQRFGTPAEERVIDATERLWIYPEIGLEMHLYTDRTNEFIYKASN